MCEHEKEVADAFEDSLQDMLVYGAGFTCLNKDTGKLEHVKHSDVFYTADELDSIAKEANN